MSAPKWTQKNQRTRRQLRHQIKNLDKKRRNENHLQKEQKPIIAAAAVKTLAVKTEGESENQIPRKVKQK